MPKATILCIDDYEPSLTSRREYFQAFGFEVLIAKDGPSGLERLQTDPVQIVILDYSMPGMDGTEVASIIRRDFPGLPIILVSGHPEEALDLPPGLVDATFLKGQRMSELRQLVETLTQRPV